ncbi:MAG: hypothetical protein ABDH20_04565 [Thermus sp.]
MNEKRRLLTIKELREVVGPEILGRDLAYTIARRHGVRLGKRLLVPSRVAEAILEGRLAELEAEGKTPRGGARG